MRLMRSRQSNKEWWWSGAMHTGNNNVVLAAIRAHLTLCKAYNVNLCHGVSAILPCHTTPNNAYRHTFQGPYGHNNGMYRSV